MLLPTGKRCIHEDEDYSEEEDSSEDSNHGDEEDSEESDEGGV